METKDINKIVQSKYVIVGAIVVFLTIISFLSESTYFSGNILQYPTSTVSNQVVLNSLDLSPQDINTTIEIPITMQSNNPVNAPTYQIVIPPEVFNMPTVNDIIVNGSTSNYTINHAASPLVQVFPSINTIYLTYNNVDPLKGADMRANNQVNIIGVLKLTTASVLTNGTYAINITELGTSGLQLVGATINVGSTINSPLQQPTNLSAQLSGTGLNVSWIPPVDANLFNVFQNSTGSTPVNTVTNNVILNPDSGVIYVQACNQSGNEIICNNNNIPSVNYGTTPYTQPGNFVATLADTGSVTLSWTTPADKTNIAQYQILDTLGNPISTIVDPNATSATILSSNPMNSVFQIQSCNVTNNITECNNINIPTAVIAPMLQPTDVVAAQVMSDIAERVNVDWVPPVDNIVTGSGVIISTGSINIPVLAGRDYIKKYQVYRNGTGINALVATVNGVDANTASIVNNPVGTAIYYVKACNEVNGITACNENNIPSSNPINITDVQPAPIIVSGGGGGGGGSSAPVKSEVVSTPSGQYDYDVCDNSKVKFTDIGGHWGEYRMDFLREKCVVNGIGDTNMRVYKPNIPIYRGEALKIALRAFRIKIDLNADYSAFTDIGIDQWFAPYIATAKKLGVVDGFADGSFKPETFITRSQALKVLFIIKGVPESEMTKYADLYKKFTDVSAGYWDTPYINYAVGEGWVDGYVDGTFKPNKSITRAEFAKIITELSSDILEFDESLDPYKSPDPVIAMEVKSDVVETNNSNEINTGILIIDKNNEVVKTTVLDEINKFLGINSDNVGTTTSVVNEDKNDIVLKPLSPNKWCDNRDYLIDIDGHWAFDDIIFLRDRCVVKGVNSDSMQKYFYPDSHTFRVEALQMAMDAYDIDMKSISGTYLFYDVKINDWFAPYVYKSQDLKLLDNKGDKNFNPYEPITRSQALKILLDLKGITQVDMDKYADVYKQFSDVGAGYWDVPYINYAVGEGYLSGYSDGTFRPMDTITKAEFVKLLLEIASEQDRLIK